MLVWPFAHSMFYCIKIKRIFPNLYLSLSVRWPASSLSHPSHYPYFCVSFWKNLMHCSSIYSSNNSTARRMVSLKHTQTSNKTHWFLNDQLWWHCRLQGSFKLPWEVSHLLYYRVRAPVVSLAKEQLVGLFFFFLFFLKKNKVNFTIFFLRIKI